MITNERISDTIKRITRNNNGESVVLNRGDVEECERRGLIEPRPGTGSGYDVTPDGQRFLD